MRPTVRYRGGPPFVIEVALSPDITFPESCLLFFRFGLRILWGSDAMDGPCRGKLDFIIVRSHDAPGSRARFAPPLRPLPSKPAGSTSPTPAHPVKSIKVRSCYRSPAVRTRSDGVAHAAPAAAAAQKSAAALDGKRLFRRSKCRKERSSFGGLDGLPD